jgi:hypothetical protein
LAYSISKSKKIAVLAFCVSFLLILVVAGIGYPLNIAFRPTFAD